MFMQRCPILTGTYVTQVCGQQLASCVDGDGTRPSMQLTVEVLVSVSSNHARTSSKSCVGCLRIAWELLYWELNLLQWFMSHCLPLLPAHVLMSRCKMMISPEEKNNKLYDDWITNWIKCHQFLPRTKQKCFIFNGRTDVFFNFQCHFTYLA